MYKDKIYKHKLIEKDWYQFWKQNNLFEPKSLKENNKLYSIILPPPNITGHLHLGHAWDGTIQDVLIRYKKLCGYNVCWFSGTDHAGISTQTKFDKIAKQQKLTFKNSDQYMENLKNWALEQRKYIHDQWAQLGFALSYDYESYTLDENVKELTSKVFIDLYNKGLIYQDYKLTNWDIKLKTAISDIEVIYKETSSKMYYFKYCIDGTKDYLVVATTRPETMFGDTNVFINPKDKRYTKYLHKFAINPVNNQKLEILSDDYIDMEFGTGAMKCTPAHDFNDYELAKKHNIKKYYSVMNIDGTLNGHCVINNVSYEGIDRLKARDAIVKQLASLNLLIKVEDYINNVGYSERTDELIEPLFSKQWFVKMKPIVKELRQKLKSNSNKLTFVPKRFEQTINIWFDNINDWCISRQLLWGHKIPAYYHNKTNELYVGNKPPKGYVQENGVLDTWFSSGLWPVVTTIYNKNGNMAKYYPTDVLVTAYDILFFWVARMLFQCNNLTSEIPFKKVLVHGLIRDEQNRKMSKSLGNGIEPETVIEQYGADALRLYLISSSTMGEDLRFSMSKISYMSNFLNKVWNIHNYLSNYESDVKLTKLTHPLNKWIYTKFSNLISKVNKLFNQYNFSVLTNDLIDFTWNVFANNYLELIHPLLNDELYGKETIAVAKLIFKNILIAIHPFCPFITENIYQIMFKEQISIMNECYFEPNDKLIDQEASGVIEKLLPIIGKIRELRIKHNIKKTNIININLIDKILVKHSKFIQDFLNNYKIGTSKISSKRINNDWDIINLGESIIEYENKFVSKDDELDRLQKQKSILEAEIARSKQILANKNFISKAPVSKVELEKSKFEKYQEEYKVILSAIAKLKAK